MVAPPTAEEEQLRAAVALGKADVGFTVGRGGQRGSGEPPRGTARAATAGDGAVPVDARVAQQFMSGQTNPGEMPSETSEEDDEEKKDRG